MTMHMRIHSVHARPIGYVCAFNDWASCHSYTVCWAMERFTIDSCVRWYLVYNDIWEASVGVGFVDFRQSVRGDGTD